MWLPYHKAEELKSLHKSYYSSATILINRGQWPRNTKWLTVSRGFWKWNLLLTANSDVVVEVGRKQWWKILLAILMHKESLVSTPSWLYYCGSIIVVVYRNWSEYSWSWSFISYSMQYNFKRIQKLLFEKNFQGCKTYSHH